jgi:hypothetical protein
LHAGAGAAHLPDVQELLQHWLADVQLDPSLEQFDDWHVPETQSLLQHAALPVHAPPRFVHEGSAHMPPLHIPLQQLLELWQALPAA